MVHYTLWPIYWYQRTEAFSCGNVDKTVTSPWQIPATPWATSFTLSFCQVVSPAKSRCRVSWLCFYSVMVWCYMSDKSTLCSNEYFYLSLESWKSQAVLMTEWLWCCTFIITLPCSNWYLQTDLGQILLKTSKAALKLYRSIQNERMQGQHELEPAWITGKNTSHYLANPRYKHMFWKMRDYHTGLEVKSEIWRTGRRICWHFSPWGQNQQNSFGSWYLKVVDLLTVCWLAMMKWWLYSSIFLFVGNEIVSVFTYVNWYSQ